MPLVAHCYSINPNVNKEVKEILLTEKKDLVYQEIVMNGKPEKFFIYVNKVVQLGDYGYNVEIYFDDLVSLSTNVRQEGEDKVEQTENVFKNTSKIELEIYPEVSGSDSITDFVSVMSPRYVSLNFVRALTKLVRSRGIEDAALRKISINMTSNNEEAVRNCFDDIKRVNTGNLDDDRLDTIGFSGMRLYETTEYNSALYTYKGRISSMAVIYDSTWFLISEKGTIITYNSMDKIDFVRIVKEIVSKLLHAKAIVATDV